MIKSFLADIGAVSYKLDEILADYTTFQIGGPADVIVYPRDEKELHLVMTAARAHLLPYFILGGGSNLLVSDLGMRGLVIHLAGEMETIKVSPDGKEIVVGTAVSFPKLTKIALECGWASALGWHGTPGLVGGALKMNAGGRLGEIGDVVESVQAVSQQGKCSFTREEAGFRYRNSSFPSDAILTFAKLRCENADREKAVEFVAKSRELVIRRKQTQPKHRSAGSMFKNPPSDFAGRLIEATGLKGTRIGDAEISQVHANFIVNLGKATAKDVRELSQLARETVYKQHGVLLEYEVKLVGEHA
jgi:UDP-N-acetylmuramate dehydrogenase